MKKIILQFAILLFAAVTAVAQAPQKFNYQGVARTSSGTPLVSTAIGLRLTVHDATATGTTLYQETFTPTTNAYGLFTVAVGTGTVVSGTFASITWASGPKYLQVEIDPAGGTAYTSIGSDQLLSVPYAMYAAASAGGGSGTVTSVTAGTGLSGGTITTTGTISMPAVGTAGTYGSSTQVPVFTTDAEGRVTSVTNTTITTGGTGTVTTVNTTPGQLTGGPITTSGTLGLATAGTAGTYGSATQVPVITTDAYGRVTSVTNTTIATGGVGTVTSVGTSPRLTGGPITSAGTIDLATSGVTAATYGSATQVPTIAVDAYGRVTSASNTTITVPTVSGTTNYVSKFTGASSIGNSMLFDNGGTVGVNTATPTNMAKLHVSGVGTYSVLPVYQAGIVADGGASSANASGVYAEGGWRGVYGRNPGTAAGTEAIGVLGRCEGSAYTGTGYGVKGEMAGTGGTANYGVYGTASGTGRGVGGFATGTGAAGYFDGGSSGYGVIVPNGISGFNTSTPTNMAKVEISGVGTYSVLPVYQAGLVVDGPSTASASGVYGEGGWRGVYGRNPGTYTGTEAIGVLGRTEGSSYTGTGYGVKGEMAGSGGSSNYGVYGTASGAGRGVGGFATGTGAAGYFDGGSSGYGVIVPNGISGFNTTTPTNMAKVQISGVGTYSVAPIYQAGLVVNGTTGASASAVYGEGGWRGVFGRNVGASGGVQAIGVQGLLETGSTYTSGYGVMGGATGGGPTNYGVYGYASGATTTNYAGYFSGNVTITGSISKGSGTFKIDHPLDPENKYLYHSFVESPDMMNIYNGNVVTDANGDATITMPDYFEALNKDFRYQLTVIGTFAQAIVKDEISGNKFTIKTDKPNVKVSWMVTGVRHDKFADAHRVVPEVEKESGFKGHYLHAEEWGQPYAKSFDAITTPSTEGNRPAEQTRQ
jgi:hypothetical protein